MKSVDQHTAHLAGVSCAAVRGGELPSDVLALISQLREAEAALQALERDGDKAAGSLAKKAELERSVKTGVQSLRDSGMADDQIMMEIMGPNVGQPPQAVPVAPPSPSPCSPPWLSPEHRGLGES